MMRSWKKIVANSKRKVFFDSNVRRAYSSLYRALFFKKRKRYKEYLCSGHIMPKIAINIAHVYFFEHIKCFYNLSRHHTLLSPVLVGPPNWPRIHYQTELYTFLSKKYNLHFGEDIIPYPWLKNIRVKAFIELGVTSYGCEIGCPRIIYTHGMGGLNFSKDYSEIKFMKNYSAIFLNGPLQKKALLTAGRMYNVPLPRMYEVGYLRGDELYKKTDTFDKEKFCARNGLHSAPTVLYAPTWGSYASPQKWMDIVVEVCNVLGVNLFIKLHPIMLTGDGVWETGGINWAEKLKRIKRLFPNVSVISDHDLDDIFLISDVMITDVSGIGLEFMYHSKPVVFLPAPQFFEIFGNERPERWCRHDYEISDKLHLKQEIKKAIDGNGYVFPCEELVYNRGNALESMHKAVLDVIDNTENSHGRRIVAC